MAQPVTAPACAEKVHFGRQKLKIRADELSRPGKPPEVQVEVPEFEGLKVKALFAADTID